MPRYREQTLKVLLAQRHRPLLRVTRPRCCLREVLVVESHERDVVGADVEQHQFVLQEGVLGELPWQVED